MSSVPTCAYSCRIPPSCVATTSGKPAGPWLGNDFLVFALRAHAPLTPASALVPWPLPSLRPSSSGRGQLHSLPTAVLLPSSPSSTWLLDSSCPFRILLTYKSDCIVPEFRHTSSAPPADSQPLSGLHGPPQGPHPSSLPSFPLPSVPCGGPLGGSSSHCCLPPCPAQPGLSARNTRSLVYLVNASHGLPTSSPYRQNILGTS